jgi:omega-amidase
MKIALIQTDLIWENPTENRSRLSQKINGFRDEVDLIVLPEMFATGFTMNPKKASETMQGETITWLQHMAKAKNCAITGSLAIHENGKYYNRLLFVHPDGKIEYYNKRHLFTLAGEHKIYTAGFNRITIDYKGWKICPLVCYDLRFPAFARNNNNYDLLLYVASWPKIRIMAWDILLKARAVENMSYVVGVNRIGVDENNNHYNGHTQAIDFMGNEVLPPQETNQVFIVTLDKSKQDKARKKFGFLNDQDSFTLD